MERVKSTGKFHSVKRSSEIKTCKKRRAITKLNEVILNRSKR